MRIVCLCLLALVGCKNTDSLPGATTLDLAIPIDLMPPPDLMPLPGVINGTFGGIAFQPTAAISANAMLGAGGTLGLIYLMDKPLICQQLSMSTPEQPKNITGIVMILGISDGGSMQSPPNAPGVYPISTGGSLAGPVATVKFLQTDAACMNVAATVEEAVGGTVTLADITGENYAGTFDVMMQHMTGDPMEHVTGEFHAMKCTGLTALANSSPACN